MKISDFVIQKNISPALTAGFLSFLRRTAEMDMDAYKLEQAYREFAGIDIQAASDLDDITDEEFGELL